MVVFNYLWLHFICFLLHILISTLPLVKVAGFSVGGVMVSTIGSDLIDRGSTPAAATNVFS